jgi:hypothetical protein
MLMYFTDTMAEGYGAAVGADVLMFMKWMGLHQMFIAMSCRMAARQEPTAQALACLGNVLLLGAFLADALVNGEKFFTDGGMPLDGLYFNLATQGTLFVLNLAGWATGGAPMPSFGSLNGKAPVSTTVNTVLAFVFGGLMIFNVETLMDQYFTFEDGTKAKPVLENSTHFMMTMFKYIGIMFIGQAFKYEFLLGAEDKTANYETLRAIMINWAMQAGMLVVLPMANAQVGFPYTTQTKYANFAIHFGMFVWTGMATTGTPYPIKEAAKDGKKTN